MSGNYSYPIYCQFCGSNQLERNVRESASKCLLCGRLVYMNSRPSVCAVIIRNNNVLLVRDSDLPELWDLPGGFLLYGESPADGLRRELKEELNAEIKVERLLTTLVDIYERQAEFSEFSLNLFYEVTLISNKIKVGAEIKEYRWFNINNLPPIKYKSTAEVLSNIRR